MSNLPDKLFEDLEEDYKYDLDVDFMELKICELDNLVKIFEEIYYNSNLKVESLLNVIVNKSARLRKYFQLFLENYISENNSCKNT